MPEPTPEQRAAAAEWIHRWRLDDSHGHVESLAELLAEREQLLRADLYLALVTAHLNRKLADSFRGEVDLLRARLRGARGEPESQREAARG